jgi:hypothetical protein
MNGALEVSGTTWVTGPTPAIVGREPVSEKPIAVELVIEGALVMDMLLPAALEPDDVAAAEAESELRFGSEVSVAWDEPAFEP